MADQPKGQLTVCGSDGVWSRGRIRGNPDPWSVPAGAAKRGAVERIPVGELSRAMAEFRNTLHLLHLPASRHLQRFGKGGWGRGSELAAVAISTPLHLVLGYCHYPTLALCGGRGEMREAVAWWSRASVEVLVFPVVHIFDIQNVRTILWRSRHRVLPIFPLPDLHIVGFMPDDAAGRRVFSEFSRSPRPCIPTLLNYTYLSQHNYFTRCIQAVDQEKGRGDIKTTNLRLGWSDEGIQCWRIQEYPEKSHLAVAYTSRAEGENSRWAREVVLCPPGSRGRGGRGELPLGEGGCALSAGVARSWRFGAAIPNSIPRFCYHRVSWIVSHYGCKYKDVFTSKRINSAEGEKPCLKNTEMKQRLPRTGQQDGVTGQQHVGAPSAVQQLVKAVHDIVSTFDLNLRKKSPPLHAYILTDALSDIRPVKLKASEKAEVIANGLYLYFASLTSRLFSCPSSNSFPRIFPCYSRFSLPSFSFLPNSYVRFKADSHPPSWIYRFFAKASISE
ncbi:hypothetical protein PR048_010117, partial [Dryococelus australis]